MDVLAGNGNSGRPRLSRNDPHDMAAVVHVHSTYSDGTATVPEIIEAAADAEADVVFLTDHDTLQARRDGYEGWHHGVLLLVGMEISAGTGHFLAFGVDQTVDHEGRSGEEICDAVASAGGLGFPEQPWRDLYNCPATGVELWSLVSEAARACRTPRQLVAFISRPEESVDHPPQHNLLEWDRLCQRRRTVAIGGLDAHQSGVATPGGMVLSPMRNARFFRMLRTHLLCESRPTGDLETDRELVLRALREGRCYLGRDSLAATRGFRYYADGPKNGFLPMGGEGTAGRWQLHVRLPFRGRIRLIRNGRQIHALNDSSLDIEVDQPGVYRVEGQLHAHGSLRTWIVSNPIYLRPEG
jgi:PHP domain-containing protein